MGKNCRNCGAPLDSRGNCEYCGTRAQQSRKSGIEITATSIRMWADGPNDDREEDENEQ